MAAGATCGDYGGLTLAGEPCGRRVKDGPCRDHCPDSTLQQAKEKVLAEYANGASFSEAAAAAGYADRTTIWYWRQADADFDQKIRAIQERVDEVRVARVEESLFTRIVAGNATAAETIFWLVNRSGGRWKHVQRVEVSGPEGGPIEHRVEDAREKLDSELERIMQRRALASRN